MNMTGWSSRGGAAVGRCGGGSVWGSGAELRKIGGGGPTHARAKGVGWDSQRKLLKKSAVKRGNIEDLNLEIRCKNKIKLLFDHSSKRVLFTIFFFEYGICIF